MSQINDNELAQGLQQQESLDINRAPSNNRCDRP